MVVDHEEFVNDVRRGRILASVIAKGKRSKRQHPMSPFKGGIATSCSWDGDAATTSDESMMISSTEEEEDMAHCLILLAQGGDSGGEKILPDMSASATRSGFDVYECKACNRVFPSFQALGGHRASHKRLKLPPPQMTTVEPAAPVLVVHDLGKEDRQFHKTALLPAPLHRPCKTLLTPGATNIAGANKQKVHECSICGTEFSSGQALGGHMRRHRSTPAGPNHAANPNSDASSASNSPVIDDKMSRNVLPLDLNLPATEDDLIDTKFGFGSTQQPPIIFPAGPALVGCHY